VVIIPPLISRFANRAGNAVISFDFSSTFTWPKVSWLSCDHAVTIQMADLLLDLSGERLRHLPSIAMTSPVAFLTIALIQFEKQT
jgi:hypothetical protein